MSERSTELMKNIASAGYDSRVFSAAHFASSCNCGKPKCLFRPGYLVGFRDHVLRLHQVLVQAQFQDGLLGTGARGWNAVTYQLQMAASISDVVADTSVVNPTASYMLCEPAADYEDRHSRLASSYAAGLIVFNFLWAAYEAAIKAGADEDFHPKQHTAFRGRELMRICEVDARQLGCLPAIVRHAAHKALHVGDLRDAEKKLAAFETGSAAYGAELVRLFRNHLAHGDDAPPTPDQHHSFCRTVRFYSLSRVLLLMIQLIGHQALLDPICAYNEEWRDEDGKVPIAIGELLLGVHLHSCEM